MIGVSVNLIPGSLPFFAALYGAEMGIEATRNLLAVGFFLLLAAALLGLERTATQRARA